MVLRMRLNTSLTESLGVPGYGLGRAVVGRRGAVVDVLLVGGRVEGQGLAQAVTLELAQPSRLARVRVRLVRVRVVRVRVGVRLSPLTTLTTLTTLTLTLTLTLALALVPPAIGTQARHPSARPRSDPR
eukprot:scaffold21302_cov50-Phaeocystis_antarctica.AAC.2